MIEVDAAIVGGGPAGSATAIALAAMGRSVAVLERSGELRPREGESLPPEIRAPLEALGLRDRFLGDGHLPSPGTVSAWGHGEPEERDFLLNPHGPGWHVSRLRFDAMLASAVLRGGGLVFRAVRRLRIAPCPRGGWVLRGEREDGPVDVSAALLVDASGRAAAAATRLGMRRVAYDRLVGIVGLHAANLSGGAGDRRTLVEAVEAGWWYSGPLPGGGGVAAFMTDVDLLRPARGDLDGFWRAQLAHAPLTSGRLGTDAMRRGRLRAVDASSTRLEQAAGAGWVAAGDAAAARDPLSGQGTYHALVTGIEAASAVHAHLGGAEGTLAAYGARVRSDYEAYLVDRRSHYGLERRWPRSPFWVRRHM